MSDTLPKLLQEIHSVETPSELNSRFSEFQSRIAAILFEQPSEENYYVNHTGREFFRKLYNYGLEHLITDPYDSGFRPILESGIQTFTVTVNGNNGAETGGGEINIGATINITASPNDLYQFNSWTVIGPGQIGSTTSANTTFTVGSGDVVITANYSIVPAPSLSGSFTDPNVLLTSSVVSGTATYQFQRSTSSDFSSDLITVQNISSNTCSDLLNSSGIYYYRVRSVNGITQTAWSNTESFNVSFPYTPSVTTTKAWYDATSGVQVSGTDVTQWDDLSGNGHHLTPQASGSTTDHTLVAAELNGLDVVRHDTDDFYSENIGAISGGNAIFAMLCKINSTGLSALDSIFSLAGAVPNFQLQAGANGVFRAHLNGSGDLGSYNSNTIDFSGDWHIFVLNFNTSNATGKVLVDGLELGSFTYPTPLAGTGLRIWANRGNNFQPSGDIAEFVVIEDSSTAHQEKIEGYLAHKWGLESNLPINHPYKSQPPLKSS